MHVQSASVLRHGFAQDPFVLEAAFFKYTDAA